MIVNAKDRLLYCLMTDADYKVTLSDYYDIRWLLLLTMKREMMHLNNKTVYISAFTKQKHKKRRVK